MVTRALLLVLMVLSSQVVAVGESAPETYEFTAEISRLMDIIINSLYTQKEIFLREVISNASDALDKIRFQSITDPSALGTKKELEIRVSIDEEAKTISVRDTGIGMTRNELAQNLGTIAKTGTTDFLEALKGGNINLIGQFGVGFYSTFLAGSKVEVTSKSNDDKQYVWVSEAASSYKLYEDPRGDTLGRGTQVKIYLKEDALDFLKHKKIIKLVKKYSEFIDFPIYLLNKKEVEEDAPAAQPAEDEVTVEDKTDEPTKVKKTVYEWEQLNTNKAIWLRDKREIDDEEYIAFYKSLSKQSNPPLNWIHFSAEAEVSFTSVLFLPNSIPHDFYQSYSTRKNDLKLYVRRVLITENKADMLPKYLSFIVGVVDSNDLPINVNRETLQQTKTFNIINQRVTKRVLDMITELTHWNEYEEEEWDSEDETQLLTEEEREKRREEEKNNAIAANKRKYNRFYSEFGKALKLGIIEDSTNRQKLASLARWFSTHNSSEYISLDDYISRMKPTQEQIYFFSGEDKRVLEKSPLVKGLVKKGYEVLLCDDPIDQYVFNTLRDYQKKVSFVIIQNIVNVGKGDFKLPDDGEFERKKHKWLTEHYKPYIEYAKKLLFEKVNSVVLSTRLTNEPCVVVADSYGQSSFMEKIRKSQLLATEGSNPQGDMKKILEINPNHRVNQQLLEKIRNNQTNASIEQLVELLYETAALQSGFALANTNDFAKRFYTVYSEALGVLNLERKQVEVDQDVELDEKDYEGDNEEVMRMGPGDMRVTNAEEE